MTRVEKNSHLEKLFGTESVQGATKFLIGVSRRPVWGFTFVMHSYSKFIAALEQVEDSQPLLTDYTFDDESWTVFKLVWLQINGLPTLTSTAAASLRIEDYNIMINYFDTAASTSTLYIVHAKNGGRIAEIRLEQMHKLAKKIHAIKATQQYSSLVNYKAMDRTRSAISTILGNANVFKMPPVLYLKWGKLETFKQQYPSEYMLPSVVLWINQHVDNIRYIAADGFILVRFKNKSLHKFSASYSRLVKVGTLEVKVFTDIRVVPSAEQAAYESEDDEGSHYDNGYDDAENFIFAVPKRGVATMSEMTFVEDAEQKWTSFINSTPPRGVVLEILKRLSSFTYSLAFATEETRLVKTIKQCDKEFDAAVRMLADVLDQKENVHYG